MTSDNSPPVAPRSWRNWSGQPAVRRRRCADPWQRRRGGRARQGGGRHRTQGQGGRQRALVHRHRGRRRPAAAAAPAGRTGGRSTANLVTVAGRHAAAPAQPDAGGARPGDAQPRRHRRCRPSPARSPPARTAAAARTTAAWPPASRRSRWSPAPGGVAARSTRRRRLFPAARLGIGALGVLVEVTLRCVRGVHAARRRAAAAAGRGARRPGRAGRGQRPLRVLLVSVHRPGPAQAQQQGAGRRTGRCRGSAAGSTTSSSRTPSSRACAGSAGRSRPPCRRSARSPPGRSPPAPTPTGPTGSSARRAGSTSPRWSTRSPASACPRCCRRCRGSSRGCRSRCSSRSRCGSPAPDDVWLSHGYGRDSAYIAVHQFVGSPYEPYFRAFEAVCAPLGGRPHWGKLHYRDAESLRTAYPRFDDFLAVRDQLRPRPGLRQRLPRPGPGSLTTRVQGYSAWAVAFVGCRLLRRRRGLVARLAGAAFFAASPSWPAPSSPGPSSAGVPSPAFLRRWPPSSPGPSWRPPSCAAPGPWPASRRASR